MSPTLWHPGVAQQGVTTHGHCSPEANWGWDEPRVPDVPKDGALRTTPARPVLLIGSILLDLASCGMISVGQRAGSSAGSPQSWRSRAASGVFPLRTGGRACLEVSPVLLGGQAMDGVGFCSFVKAGWRGSGINVPSCSQRVRRETLVLERFLLAITGQKSVAVQQPGQPVKGPAPPW